MHKLVTIGVPIYKRLDYLPNVLSKVAAQDHPNIDLLVSDNGMNGTKVSDIVKQHYSQPFRFRQNPETVGPSHHFNQIIHNALGEYVVLLADDDEIVQAVVSAAAEKFGHRVIRAMNGGETLEVAASTQPDVVILDIRFPDADGRDVLAKLKGDLRTAHIPVIVWSGRNSNDSDSRIALELGAEDFVEKGDAEFLMLKLERVLLRIAK